MAELPTDLTTEHGVIALMQSSKDSAEWDGNCNRVKSAHGGCYPLFWYAKIVASGLADKVMKSWVVPASTKIYISSK